VKDKNKEKHYVDNKKFYEEIKKYRELCIEAEEAGDPTPKVPEYIGSCFLKIANGLSYKPNFINYTYRDEMVADGIENCLQYIYNFNPEKSKNPFSYFTQIIYYAFLRRIQKEKKQTHIKHKIIEKNEYLSFETMEGDEGSVYGENTFDATVMLPDEPVYKPKKSQKAKPSKSSLENFMDIDYENRADN